MGSCMYRRKHAAKRIPLGSTPALHRIPRMSEITVLLEQVQVNVEGNSERVEVELRWAGGFVSRHALRRPVTTYEQLSPGATCEPQLACPETCTNPSVTLTFNMP